MSASCDPDRVATHEEQRGTPRLKPSHFLTSGKPLLVATTDRGILSCFAALKQLVDASVCEHVIASDSDATLQVSLNLRANFLKSTESRDITLSPTTPSPHAQRHHFNTNSLSSPQALRNPSRYEPNMSASQVHSTSSSSSVWQRVEHRTPDRVAPDHDPLKQLKLQKQEQRVRDVRYLLDCVRFASKPSLPPAHCCSC